MVCHKYLIYSISHRSISSQSGSIAGDETVLFILMVTALQQTVKGENGDEIYNMKQWLHRVTHEGIRVKKSPSKFSEFESQFSSFQRSLIWFTKEADVMLNYLWQNTKARMQLGCYAKGGELFFLYLKAFCTAWSLIPWNNTTIYLQGHLT